MKRWGRIKSLIIKEFRNIWNDPKNRNMLFLSPIIQLLVFAYAVTMEVKNIDVAVYDKDKSNYSRDFIGKVKNTEMIKNLYFVDNRDQMVDLINKQKVAVALTIPADFSKNITLKENSSIQLILDGRKANTSQIVAGYISLIAQKFQAEISQETETLKLNTRYWFNPTLDYKWTMVIMLTGILALSMALSITAISLAQEKELGTFEQTLVAPLKSYEILIGKIVSAIVVALFDMSTMLLVAIYHFKIPLTTNIFVLYGVVILFLLSICGIGLFISSLCNTQQQAILGVFAFLIPAILISGFVTPVEHLPFLFQKIAIVNPLTYFFVLIKGMFLKSMPFYLVWENCVPLIFISIFTLTFSGIYFNKKRG